jgi:hypothetical protein
MRTRGVAAIPEFIAKRATSGGASGRPSTGKLKISKDPLSVGNKADVVERFNSASFNKTQNNGSWAMVELSFG